VPGTLRTTPMPLEVACDYGPARGAVIADRYDRGTGRTVDVALEADLPAIHAELLRRFSSR
jgi:pyrimidine-specific ribonucleoside hydrolase